jgi:copper chaperone CopZ
MDNFRASLKHILLIASILLVASCAIVYKTDSIGQNINKIKSDLNGQIQNSKKSFVKIEKSWELVSNAKKIPKKEKFQKAEKSLKKVRKIIHGELDEELKKFNKFSTEKWNFIKEKKKIRKSDPRYKSYLELQQYVEDLSKRLEEKNNRAQKIFKKVQKYFKSLKLYEVNPKKLSKDVNKSLKKMNGQISQVRSKLKQLSQNVEKDKNRTRKNQRKKVITKLNHILNKIQTAKLKFQPLLDRFNIETKGKNKKILVIPEMASHTILKELEVLVKKVQGLGKQFNSRVEELKALQ